MRVRKSIFGFLLILAILLTACGGGGAANPTATPTQAGSMPTEAMMDDHSGEMMATETVTGTMMAEPSGEMMGTETPSAMMDDHSGEMMATETVTGTMMAEPSGEMMGTETPGAMMDDHSGDMMGTETPGAMSGDSGQMMGSPQFFTASLTEASSGQAFTIQDLKGKVVLVETMAIWCTNCLQQQKQIQALHEQLGRQDNLVSLSLDIDPNEDTAALKSYVAKNNFDWNYAVAPASVAREIGQLYGAQFLNPTSTPMFIIDSHGEVHTLPFGIKSAQALKDALDPYLNAGM